MCAALARVVLRGESVLLALVSLGRRCWLAIFAIFGIFAIFSPSTTPTRTIFNSN
jgi:hypothetical protein